MTQQVTYISTSEVARTFGVDGSTVRRWVLAGTIKPSITTPGGHHKFTRECVDQLVAASAQGIPSANATDVDSQASA